MSYNGHNPENNRGNYLSFKTEFILIGVLLAIACAAYIALNIGDWDLFAPKEQKPAASPIAVVSDGDSAKANSGKTIDCGNVVCFVGRSVSLTSASDCSGFESANTAVATVSESGAVTAVSFGDADITGKCSNGDTYIYHVQARKVAYLTFSDFPNDKTNTILDVLKKENVKATFFVCLRSKEEYHPLYRRILDEGHAMGNHTSSHDTQSIFEKTDTLIATLTKEEKYLDENFGCKTKLVSIPGGTVATVDTTVRKKVAEQLHDKGYSLVDWTLDVGDYATISQSEILNKIKDKCVGEREVISMHHNESTADILPKVIEYLRSAGYEFDNFNSSPEIYSQLYGWEKNPNQKGQSCWTADTISGMEYAG